MAEFCREVVPTRAMKLTVTAMYIHIVNLLERAVKYHSLGTSSQ